MALIGDDDFFNAGFGELTGKRAELFSQRNEGLQLWRFFCGDGGEVDRIGNGTAHQIIGHLLRHLKRNILLRLSGGRAQMRRAHHIRVAEQRVCGGGFFDKDVKSRAGDMAAVECGAQGHFIHQAATGTVDDAHALFGFGQIGFRKDVFGLGGHGRVQGDDVGARQQIIQLDLFHAHIQRAVNA